MKEQQNLLIRTWTPEALAFVSEQAITREFNAGDWLCRDGETITHFIFPNSGIVVALSASDSDKSLEVKSTGREGFIGIPRLFAGGECAADVKGLVAGQATLIPCNRLHEATALFPCVHHSLVRYGRFAILTLMQTIACIRSQSAEQVIVLWLLTASDRLESPDIAITHEMLSNLLGLRRATVTTTLSKLSRKGVLETKRGVIHITNPDDLKQIGGVHYTKWQNSLSELTAELPPERPPAS